MADWEYVLSDMDRGYSNIFTGIYGGSECGEDPGPFASITAEYGRKSHDATLSIPAPLSNDLHDLSPEAWSASSSDYPLTNEHTTQSVPSYSSESMGSNEDTFTSLADASVRPDEMGLLDPFQGLTMPGKDEMDEFGLVNGWDRRLAV
jgi:hypothetical protein